MNAGDWIAVASALFAGLAFIVAGRTYQLQQAGSRGDAQATFDELVHKLWTAGVSMGQPGPGQVQGINAPAAMGDIQVLALQAHDLLQASTDGPPHRRFWLSRLWNPLPDPPKPNWFEAVVLALSFAQVYDLKNARDYWTAAGDLSNKSSVKGTSAEIYTLRWLGAFYYSANGDGDLKRARDAFDRAASVLGSRDDADDLTNGLNSETRFLQAGQEEQLGNHPDAVERLAEAWRFSNGIQAAWRRQRVQLQICYMIAFGGDPRRFDGYGLPQDIATAVANLVWQVTSQTPEYQRQQAYTVGFQQGVASTLQQAVQPAVPGSVPAGSAPGFPQHQPVPSSPPPGFSQEQPPTGVPDPDPAPAGSDPRPPPKPYLY
jgi:hypothetical protein